jgi:hypothetical protein
MEQGNKELAVSALKKITGKTNIIFQESCREAAKTLVGKLKQKNPSLKKILLQEEGGWHTYPKLAAPNNLKLIYLPMARGKIKLEELKKHGDSILLLNSMPGYAYKENMQAIQNICKEKHIILIDDCSASIGTQKPLGDYIICSLGKFKPLSTGKGGFIATNNSLEIKEEKYEPRIFGLLLEEINGLKGKLGYWKSLKIKMLEELAKEGFNILNEETGINLFVEHKNQKERETLINYIKTKKYEYVECPKYIRTNEKAVSIEIKRKQPKVIL